LERAGHSAGESANLKGGARIGHPPPLAKARSVKYRSGSWAGSAARRRAIASADAPGSTPQKSVRQFMERYLTSSSSLFE
jgi:hypothetical protein